MKPKTLKILITGIVLMIIGPVIGWVLTITGFFHAAAAMHSIQPGGMPDFERAASEMAYLIVPILLGVLFWTAGFFSTLYALITHFSAPIPMPDPTLAASAAFATHVMGRRK
jgi:hypothetical protein